MGNTPKITVIVPVYNMEKTLNRALDSLVNQSYRDYEVIMVDDGSKDKSGMICDEYAAKFPHFKVCHKSNGGLSSARNKGMELANGEWVTFCDSDDYAFPFWLENYQLDESEGIDLIQQGARSDKPAFMQSGMSNICGFDYSGGIYEYLNLLITNRMVGYTWMKAYRMDIIRRFNLAFDVNIILAEDEVFLLKYLCYCTSVKAINKQGYNYFVPNWGKKYNLKSEELLYLGKCQVINSSCLFADDIKTPIVRFYKDSYTCFLMTVFAKKPKMKYLKEIRQLHKEDYACSRLFKPLKWVIVKDQTSIISWLMLLIHANLRRIFIAN